MGEESIELFWWTFWLIKVIVSLCFFGAVALTCKRLLRRIPWNRGKRCSVKHTVVHSFGTPRSPRSFDASESKAVNLRSGEERRSNG
jgi:hypothetical protein